MIYREARIEDVQPISRLLHDLVSAGKRTSPSDPDFVRANYVANPLGVRCTLAESPEGGILGFQSLIKAIKGNRFDVEEGWGIIGTHVSPRAARRGVGKGLWAASKEAARLAGIKHVDASIGPENEVALAYYEAMGFRTYRTPDGYVCKVYTLDTD